MAIKTTAQIISSLVSWIKHHVKSSMTSAGSLLRNTVIDAPAQEIGDTYDEVSHVQGTQGVESPDNITTEELDALAYNWNLSRKGAVAATGFVTFSRTTPPSSNIRIGAVDGSGGIIVSTTRKADGSVVSFTTTTTSYLRTDVTQDSRTGLYSVSIPIICNQSGSIGNVDANSIVVISSSVPGISKVTNVIATSGGKDIESNSELAHRVKIKARGLHYGIWGGAKSLALEQSYVIDAEVVGPEDEECVRMPDGGGVDIYILGENLTARQQTARYITGQSEISFSRKPVTDIISVTGFVGLTQRTFTPDVDYEFSQDSTSEYAYSTQSNDKLTWLGNILPNHDTDVLITYRYDKAIYDLQDTLDQDDYKFVGASVVVKRSTEVLVDISVTVTKYSGYETETVENDVITAITNLVNNLELGEGLQESDLVNVIHDVEGVNNITIPLDALHRRGDTGTQDISAAKLEYLRVDSNSINVVVN